VRCDVGCILTALRHEGGRATGPFSKSVLFERVSGSVQTLPRTVRVLEVGYRLLGLGAIFGLAIPIYWLSVLRVIGKSTMSSQAFYAPFAVLNSRRDSNRSDAPDPGRTS
jgi:hypothetical protein